MCVCVGGGGGQIFSRVRVSGFQFLYRDRGDSIAYSYRNL